MTDIVYTTKCCVIRQFSLIGYGLEVKVIMEHFVHVLGNCIGKAYITNFKQDYMKIFLLSFLLSVLPRYIIIHRIVWLIDRASDRSIAHLIDS